ncbi:hypothetical protein QOT17_006850 [Balamuthia mandrillaris]
MEERPEQGESIYNDHPWFFYQDKKTGRATGTSFPPVYLFILENNPNESTVPSSSSSDAPTNNNKNNIANVLYRKGRVVRCTRSLPNEGDPLLSFACFAFLASPSDASFAEQQTLKGVEEVVTVRWKLLVKERCPKILQTVFSQYRIKADGSHIIPIAKSIQMYFDKSLVDVSLEHERERALQAILPHESEGSHGITRSASSDDIVSANGTTTPTMPSSSSSSSSGRRLLSFSLSSPLSFSSSTPSSNNSNINNSGAGEYNVEYLLTDNQRLKRERDEIEFQWNNLNKALEGLQVEEELKRSYLEESNEVLRRDLREARQTSEVLKTQLCLNHEQQELLKAELTEMQQRLNDFRVLIDKTEKKLEQEEETAKRVMLQNIQLAKRVREMEEEERAFQRWTHGRDLETGSSSSPSPLHHRWLHERIWEGLKRLGERKVMVVTVFVVLFLGVFLTRHLSGNQS